MTHFNCGSLYCSGMEPNLQYLWGVLVVCKKISSKQSKYSAVGRLKKKISWMSNNLNNNKVTCVWINSAYSFKHSISWMTKSILFLTHTILTQKQVNTWCGVRTFGEQKNLLGKIIYFLGCLRMRDNFINISQNSLFIN